MMTLSVSNQSASASSPKSHRSLRGSAGSSSFKPMSPHRSPRDILFSLPISPTALELYELKVELDHECLRLAIDIELEHALHARSEVNSVTGLVSFLSDSLSKCRHPGTLIYQEAQLRALVSALALLHYNKVYALDPDFWNELKLKNLYAQFRKIAFQLQSDAPLADRIRHAPNVYLVQIASQYISFFGRGDSPLPSVADPAVNIIFAGLSLVGGSSSSRYND